MEQIPEDPEQSSRVLQRLDSRVRADFDRYVEAPAKKRIEEAKRNVGIWSAVSAMLADGRWTKQEQAAFSRLFGDDALHSVKTFVSGCSAEELRNLLPTRLQSAEDELRALIPLRSGEEINEIRRQITNALSPLSAS